MKRLLLIALAWLALPLVASAADEITLGLRKTPGMIVPDETSIVLWFSNSSQATIELEMPVEGSGFCDQYFELEAVMKDGRPANRQIMYAPAYEPYTVKLRPRGMYGHQIQPGAYLNNVGASQLARLRVRYINPTTKLSLVSPWLDLTPKPQ